MSKSILEKEFLTVTEVRDYLNLSKSSAYALVHRKDFPIAHFGGSVRIPRKAFMVWVDQNVYIPRSMKGVI